MIRGSRVLCAILAATVVACTASGPRTRAGGAVAPLAVRLVDWDPSRSRLSHVRAVADAGATVVVFSDEGAETLSNGAVVAIDRSAKGWIDAATIPGADGAPHWIVGIDAGGRMYRLRNQNAFEDVSARYGLQGHPVLAAATIGPRDVAFLLQGETAVAHDGRVTFFGTGGYGPAALAGGGGYAASLVRGGIALFNPATGSAFRYELPGVTRAVVGSDGRLYATTARAVYATFKPVPNADLILLFDAQGSTIHGLAASGARVWFADGRELGVVDEGRVAETRGGAIPKDARLASSGSGDVWVIASGRLLRFARVEGEPSIDSTWNAVIAPIFARECASCHAANGEAGVDLSTAFAWQAERDAIRNRVVETQTMPPRGHALTAVDRADIAAWAKR